MIFQMAKKKLNGPESKHSLPLRSKYMFFYFISRAIIHSLTRGSFIKTMHLAKCLTIKSECLLSAHSQAAGLSLSQFVVSVVKDKLRGVAFNCNLSNMLNRKNPNILLGLLLLVDLELNTLLNTSDLNRGKKHAGYTY